MILAGFIMFQNIWYQFFSFLMYYTEWAEVLTKLAKYSQQDQRILHAFRVFIFLPVMAFKRT